MNLKEILEKKGGDIFSIGSDATLKEAVDELVKRNIGALAVRDLDGRIAGILTERDILRQSRKAGAAGASVRVREIMSKQVVSSADEKDVDDAILQMFLHQVRHLLVTSGDKPIGVVSARDMLLASLLRSQEENLRFRQAMMSSFEAVAGKKILIAEASPQELSTNETAFAASGAVVLKARDGETCLREARDSKPDLIILSDLLPKLSGYEVAEKLRRGAEEARKIPIIVTAEQPTMGSLFRDLGIEHYLLKPASPYALLKRAEAIFHFGEETLLRSVPKNYAVGAGIQQYEMERIRTFLRSFALTVDLFSSEEACLLAVRKDRPKFVFVFFWEESDKFDALKIYRTLQEDPRLKSIPLVCFCQTQVQGDARQGGLGKALVTYEHVDDLMQKFVKFLREKVVPR